ncbi:RNA-directed DNA polymerase (reversetranscriptase)-related family protein, partial [Striga asiatica]
HKTTDSWLWNTWLKCRHHLEKGTLQSIDDGKNTSIWSDPWLAGTTNLCPIPIFPSDRQTLKKDQLSLKGIQSDPICKVCGTAVETLEHILFSCSRAINVWKLAGIDWAGFRSPSITFKIWWTDICNMKRVKSFNDRIHYSSYILWRLWKCQNLWIFNNIWKSERDIANQAWREWMEYEDPSLNAS